ncbi:hypothetical protein [Gemmata sp.]|uniref:hypothetical protein n=1 Tax=Gemmata sp. TaxID=1914242 RepID=UPI003F6F7D5B
MELTEGQDVALVKGAAVRVKRSGGDDAVVCEVTVGNEHFEAVIPVQLLRPKSLGVTVNLRHLGRAL